MNQEVTLRGVLAVARQLEEGGETFYKSAAERILDPKAKELCNKIAGEERDHADAIAAILEKWIPKPLDPDFENWVIKELAVQNIFDYSFPEGATDTDILQYAIEQEKKIGVFYASFKEMFPDEWKKEYVQLLVNGEIQHETELSKQLAVAA